MHQTPNFNNRQIIAAQELKVWDASTRSLIGALLKNVTTRQGAGILDQRTSFGFLENDFFAINKGSIPSGGNDTLKVGDGSGILNVENLAISKIPGLIVNNPALQEAGVILFKYKETDNIVIPGDNTEGRLVVVGFTPIINPMEDGACAITSSNQVTIVGGDFTKLRDQSTKNPSKIRFYNEDGTPAQNNQIYEVITKVNDTQIIIGGAVVDEPNLKMVIVGSYDLSVYGSLENKTAFATINGQLYFAADSDDIINAGGFVIADLIMDGAGSYTITDRRSDYLVELAVSYDLLYKSRVQDITGQKTFKTVPPKFAIPTIQVFEPTTKLNPLVPPISIQSAYLNVITIPKDLEGAIYTIKTTPERWSLGRINVEGGYVAGTKLYLRVDPSGTAPRIETQFDPITNVSLPGAIRSVNPSNENLYAAGSLFKDFTFRKGSIVELIADENLVWWVLNSDCISTDGWVAAALLKADNSWAGEGNNVYYQRHNDVVYIQIDALSAPTSPLHFQLPEGYYPSYHVHLYPLSSSISDGQILVSPTGLVTISWNGASALQIIRKQLIYHI